MNDLCPHCRYSLSGLPANARCPECGNRSMPMDVSSVVAPRMLMGFRWLIATPILFAAWLAAITTTGLLGLILYDSVPAWLGWIRIFIAAMLAIPLIVALVGWWLAHAADPERESGKRRLHRVGGRWIAPLGFLSAVGAIASNEFESTSEHFRAMLMCSLLVMGVGIALGLGYLRQLVRASELTTASRSVGLAYSLSLIQLPLVIAIWLILASPQGATRDTLFNFASVLECAAVAFMALGLFRTCRHLARALARDVERARGFQWCAAGSEFAP